MVILYNQNKIVELPEKQYNNKSDEKKFSRRLNSKGLTRQNKLFLQSLGLKVLV